MTKNEEKAIETLKEVASDDFDTLGDDISPKMAQNILNVIDKQQKETEEKTTILLAGAEKVKQLEKGNRSLMESRIKWKNRYYKEKAKNKECISKDKIREKIEELKEIADEDNPEIYIKIDAYEELLEEN